MYEFCYTSMFDLPFIQQTNQMKLIKIDSKDIYEWYKQWI